MHETFKPGHTHLFVKMCHSKGFFVFMNNTVNEKTAKDKFFKFSISIYAIEFKPYFFT